MARSVMDEIYCKYAGRCEFRYKRRYGSGGKVACVCHFEGRCSQQSMFLVEEEMKYYGDDE